MNERRTFWRKVIYIVAIAILVVPLHLLSLPATLESRGGYLAQLRTDYGLAEANLGEIDASAETVKLATLGLRGVAVEILWEKANYYKKIEDWTNFGAVLTQITYLQPHFIKVWDFQAHNLTYNTSVEFDDYHDRYFWVKEGIKFLRKGKYLNTNPSDARFTESNLTKDLGWFISNKIGKADEHRQYRRLFIEDDDFHANDLPNGPKRRREERDNWLVGGEYFQMATDEVNRGAQPPKTPVLFFSQKAMALIYYADALESDSMAGEPPHFGDRAKLAWQRADKELTQFGHRDLPSIYGSFIRVDGLEDLVAKEANIEADLDKLMPGEMKAYIEENKRLPESAKEKLTKEEIEDLETPTAKRSGGQQTTAFVIWQRVAERTAPEHRGEALKLAAQFEDIEMKARDIRSSRDIVNYAYWKARCDAEQTDAALKSRELISQADHEKQEARPMAAKKKYEEGFAEWRKVLDQFQVLHDDSLSAQDLAEIVDRYRDTLRQLAGNDAKFPEKFILQDVLDLNERTNGSAKAQAVQQKEPPKATAQKPNNEGRRRPRPPAVDESKPDKPAGDKPAGEKGAEKK